MYSDLKIDKHRASMPAITARCCRTHVDEYKERRCWHDKGGVESKQLQLYKTLDEDLTDSLPLCYRRSYILSSSKQACHC